MDDSAALKNEIDSLEPRVERLKSLYQQYFMGIEKIPPNVLRKDVDRTIWRLRKLRFQNTRLRFKFQQIIQRYNTYQQYWQRVMRQIEKGTYHRDVVRAAKRFGQTEVLTAAGRRAQAALHRSQPPPDEDKEPKKTVWELPDELAGAAVGGDGSDFDPASLLQADDWEDDAPTPPSKQYKVPKGVRPLMGDPAPPEPKRARPQPPHPRHEVGGAASKPPPDESGLPRQGALPGARKSAPRAARKRGALPGALAGARKPKATPAPDASPSGPGRAPPPTPTKPGPPPVAAAAGRPPPPPPPSGRGAPADRQPARPPLPKPPARPAPKRPAPKAVDRKQQIYEEYVRARKAAGQPTKGITYEKLARSLDSQTEALRKKHGTDKKVDYEVVTQNGRPMIKPKVK